MDCIFASVDYDTSLENGPTPFQWLFATGFSGSYNTFGSGYNTVWNYYDSLFVFKLISFLHLV